jgi:hypothetical protein
MVTELEQAIWAAAEPIRATRFSRILRNARRSERDPTLPGPDDETQMWELSYDPAIQRTLAATTAAGIERQAPPATDSDWYRWNLAAKRAVCRMAAKCWAGIDAQRRAVFVDEDNFQPVWGQSNLFDLRSDTPGRHLAFEGLADPDVRAALSQIFKAAKTTPAYENALRADRELERSQEKLMLWARLAKQGHDNLAAALHNLMIGEGRQRGLEIVSTVYAGTQVEGVADAFRRYNRLVQQVIWSLLGLAEIIPTPFLLTKAVGTLRCTRDADGSPFIRVTSVEGADVFLRVTYPVWLDTGTPLDGLHLLIGYTMYVAGGALSDLSLTPMSWSAGCWPESLLERGASPTTHP